MENKPVLLVLAAGMGSRYGGLKQMDGFGPNGETIIDYSIYDAIEAGFGKVVFIIREHFRQEFEAVFSGKYGDKIEVDFVTQELENLPIEYKYSEDRQKPWGTGHAVWVAHEHIDEPFAVINGDDYYGKTAFKDLVKFFEEDKENFAVMGYYLKNTLSEHGTVNRGVCYADEDGYLTKVVECTKISRNEDCTISFPTEKGDEMLTEETLVSMNLWGFNRKYFESCNRILSAFLESRGQEEKSELYIPNVVDEMINGGEVKVKVLETDSHWFGVTYQDDKPFVVERINQLIKEGVYPENLWGSIV